MSTNEMIEELQQQLQRAEERAEKREGSVKEQVAAYESLATAQRALAQAKGLEHAVPVDVGCLPEAAVSGPVLLQTDAATFLTFSAMRIGSDGMRHDAGTAVVEVQRCTITRFGYPNDEALPGHPLYGRGLSAYGIFEVRNSRWIRVLVERNSVSFPAAAFANQNHYFITFHDSSFECIADSLKVTLTTQPYAEVFTSLSQRLFSE